MGPNDDAYSEPKDAASEAIPEATKSKARSAAFDKLKRDLSTEELGNSGVQKLLLNDIDRLESECVELSSCRARLHEAELEIARYVERLRTHTKLELLSTGSVAVGSSLLGFTPSVWGSGAAAFLMPVLGLALLICGILAKWVKA